jgi:chromate reductase, NAD(P)H dehydrogenase (quinone)
MSPNGKTTKFSFAHLGIAAELAKISLRVKLPEQSTDLYVIETMYIIISGTNRVGSNTIRVAQQYKLLLNQQGIESGLLSLERLNVLERNPVFEKIEQEQLIPASKFIFISPEYNGSIPGVLKCMFDISNVREAWAGKKALLTGVSTGRAGNLRGMEHLTGILHYMRMVVHPNKLPISVVDKLFNGEDLIADQATIVAIRAQLDEFFTF